MDCRIVKKEAFKVIGKVFKVSTKGGAELREIPELWDTCNSDAPELEVYFPGNPSAQDYKCEVWIPIIKNS